MHSSRILAVSRRPLAAAITLGRCSNPSAFKILGVSRCISTAHSHTKTAHDELVEPVQPVAAGSITQPPGEPRSHRKRRRPTVSEVRDSAQLREKQLEIARANTLFRPAGRFLAAKEPGAALEACHKALSELENSRPVAYRMYENAIAVFLHENHFLEACHLYVRMVRDDGFLPSLVLRAKMDAISLASENPNETSLVDVLCPTLCDPMFDTQCLLQLIRFLGRDAHIDPAIIKEIIAAHTASRGPGVLTPDEVFVELIKLEQRRDTLNRAAWEGGMREEIGKILGIHFEESQYAGEPVSPLPYNAVLRELPQDALESYASVIQWMSEAGVTPDLETYTALIDIQARRGRYDKVFALYRLLRAKAIDDPNMIPNARVFQSLFLARRSCDRVADRTVPTRKGKVPLDPTEIPSGRELFRDMLDAHLRHTGGRPTAKSPSLGARALHAALRDLVHSGDDAGAYVAVRTFTACGIAANFHAYHAVVMGLVGRIIRIWHSRERTPREEYWLHTLLAPANDEIDAARGRQALRPTLAMVLLRFGREPSVRNDELPPTTEDLYPLDVPVRVWNTSERGFVPSAEMLVGDAPPAIVDKWDVLQLERILRRAIAAWLPRDADGRTATAAEVGAVVVAAKADMVPPRTVREIYELPTDNRARSAPIATQIRA